MERWAGPLVEVFCCWGRPAELRGADTTLAQLIVAVRAKAQSLENSAVTREGFQSFAARFKLQVGYSDYVVARLLFEATRDAGFWNLHWKITNRPPNSDNIWSQWKAVNAPHPLAPTAIAECDELSALFAFLAGRVGVRGIGLFWPYPNHTVAVWTVGLCGWSSPRRRLSLRTIIGAQRSSTLGGRRRFMNISAATSRIRSRFLGRCLLSSCGKWISTPGRRMRLCRC